MQGNPYYVDVAGNFASGYNTATLPQQMKQQQQAAMQQQQMNAMKQQMMQQQMQNAPQEQAAKMQQMQLQNKGLGLSNQIDAQKLQAAKLDQQRRSAFMSMMQGNGGSSQPPSYVSSTAPVAGAPVPIGQSMPTGSANAPANINYKAPYGQTSPNPMQMNGGLAPGQMPTQAASPQLPGQPAARPMPGQAPMSMPTGQPQQPNAQNNQPSAVDQVDQMYLNPQTRAQFGDLWKDYAPNAKQQIINDPQTGQAFVATTLPSGKVDFKPQQIGPTAEQTAFDKEIGKSNAQQYDSISTQQANISQSSIALDGVINALQDPDLQRIVGPTGQSFTTKLFGSPEDKKKLGDFEAYSGKIWQDAMQSLRGLGSASNADSSSIQKMKPNENDNYDVIYGKTMALKQTSELLNQRNKVYFDLMKQPGMRSQEALRMAQNTVSMDQIKPQIEDMMKGNMWVQFPDGKVKSVKAREVSKYTSPDIGGRIYGQ